MYINIYQLKRLPLFRAVHFINRPRIGGATRPPASTPLSSTTCCCSSTSTKLFGKEEGRCFGPDPVCLSRYLLAKCSKRNRHTHTYTVVTYTQSHTHCGTYKRSGHIDAKASKAAPAMANGGSYVEEE